MTSFIRFLEDVRSEDIGVVGGKNAALGELRRALTGVDVGLPVGFAITAAAYREALTAAGVWPRLHVLLAGLDTADTRAVAKAAAEARDIVYRAMAWAPLLAELRDAYGELKQRCGDVAMAVRSSATAEDLPTASFAGQHDSFLGVRGEDELIDACLRCFASLFTDRAIVYRTNNGFDHFKVSLSVGVMQMVRSDLASSGVAFTIDTESGFADVVYVTGGYGLGESIVQGRIEPDQFYVHKPTFLAGHRVVLRHILGSKQTKLVLDRHGAPVERPVRKVDRARYCATDEEVLQLADIALTIERHFSAKAGRPMPMDIEWAKDGGDGRLYIVQARPETAASRTLGHAQEHFRLTGSAETLVSGNAVGRRIAAGPARIVRSPADLASFRQGEVLVAETTNPDWEQVMKRASALVTDRGGRTCHAAILAREIGVPAVVGTGDATRRIGEGKMVTVTCAEGAVGRVLAGQVPFAVDSASLAAAGPRSAELMVNLGDPDQAFEAAMLPVDGVGLARMEFIISRFVRAHPMALAHPERIASPRERAAVERLCAGAASPADYFVAQVSEGVGMIAAAFFPRPVIVRLSDFKTNEYAGLLGGRSFEPRESNPMLGFRGAARYAHPAYADGFALECKALAHVRGAMGLTNLKAMVPFCRRVDEAKSVLAAMAANGLRRGDDGLEVYMMCEIPNNVIQIDAFCRLFDGVSIGSNDLTQLVLGVDRDSEMVAFDFDEGDPGVLEMLRQAIAGAHRNGRHVGICGEAPADRPDIARFLVAQGIDSISVNPASVPDLLRQIAAPKALAVETANA